jgi:hypothetical protein
MFEDLIIKPKKDGPKKQLYRCEHADQCNADFCLHKEPHYKTELGRPEQPENEEPCDCSVHECKYFMSSKGKTVCKPI